VNAFRLKLLEVAQSSHYRQVSTKWSMSIEIREKSTRRAFSPDYAGAVTSGYPLQVREELGIASANWNR
jgi:hypothetical protein